MSRAGPDFGWLTEPVAPDEPCGPDLDLSGDIDYFQVVSRIEGLLPATFFTRDDAGRQQIFDRSTINFATEFRDLIGLLDRTRDLRLLTMYSRLAALSRDLAGLAGSIAGLAGLLRERWAEVYPQGDGGDFAFRGAVIQALDDMPTMILPLQYIPIVDNRRLGVITFRAIMVANGEAQPREDEPAPDRPAIDRALADADLDKLRATRGHFAAIREAVDAIRAVSLERAGFEQAASFDRLPLLVGRILAEIDPILTARDPGAAPPDTAAEGETSDSQPGPQPHPGAGAITDLRTAAAALRAVSAYLRQWEPSSPAELLVRQAQDLVGKSFLEVIRRLVPDHADLATIAIGPDRLFALSFQQLSDVPASSGADEASVDRSDAQGDDVADEPLMIPRTRREAVGVLQNVVSFYRVSEPSSPIPLLLDRAVAMTERDFATLLKDVLPTLVTRDPQ